MFFPEASLDLGAPPQGGPSPSGAEGPPNGFPAAPTSGTGAGMFFPPPVLDFGSGTAPSTPAGPFGLSSSSASQPTPGPAAATGGSLSGMNQVLPAGAMPAPNGGGILPASGLGVMPPSGAAPPSAMSPSGAAPPGVMPPSGAPPPGVMPPTGAPPPGVMPPSGAPPPGVMPPNGAPPAGVMPQGGPPPVGVSTALGAPLPGAGAAAGMPPVVAGLFSGPEQGAAISQDSPFAASPPGPFDNSATSPFKTAVPAPAPVLSATPAPALVATTPGPSIAATTPAPSMPAMPTAPPMTATATPAPSMAFMPPAPSMAAAPPVTSMTATSPIGLAATVPSPVPSTAPMPISQPLAPKPVAEGQQAAANSLRPPCAVIAFSVDGRILKAAPSGKAKEIAIQDILKDKLGEWHADLDAFPGPFGRVENSTTEALQQYLEKLSSRLEAGSVENCSLESAMNHPHSAAIACKFLFSLLATGGRVQSQAFWSHFSPVLAKRAASLRQSGETTATQSFCARLCSGDVPGALQDACVSGLWSHALAVSRLVSPDACDGILLKFRDSLSSPHANKGSAGLSEQELADPAVQALLLLYEALGKGSAPEISEKALAGWPAFLAVFSLLLRPCDHRNLAVTFIEALAARLAGIGDIFAAHTCYLITGERSLEAVDAPSSLVCLMGVEHRTPKNFSRLLEPMALQLSEAYEYAVRTGNADALCPTLQPFKLAHAMLLAEVGLTDKARRYMTLLQAFVKAVPQNRLSDAFRSSMREFNEVLTPTQLSGQAGPPGEAPRVGKMVKDLFRGFAETTGLSVKPTPPPALPLEEDESMPPSTFTPMQPLLQNTQQPPFQTPQQPQFQTPQQPPFQTPQQPPSQMPQQPFQPMTQPATTPTQPFMPISQSTQDPLPSAQSLAGSGPSGPSSGPCGGNFGGPSPFAVGASAQSQPVQNGPPSPLNRYPDATPLLGQPGSFQAQSFSPQQSFGGACGSGCSGLGPQDGIGFGSNTADSQADRPKPPDRMDYSETLESDPLLNAGKAVFGFGKSLFSAIKGGEANDEKKSPEKQSQASGFYYDKEKGRWRQHGVEDDDASQYDPMTGKKLMPKVTEPPPPPPPMGGGFAGADVPPMGGQGPPMGGPPSMGLPMGGPPSMGPPPAGGCGGGNPYSGGMRGAGAAGLYVDPMTGTPAGGFAPPMGGAAPSMGGCGFQQPFSGSAGAPDVRPLGSPFGGPPGGALSSPFVGNQQAGGVRASPFG